MDFNENIFQSYELYISFIFNLIFITIGTCPKQIEFPIIETLRGGKPQGVSCIIYESEQGMRLKSLAGETSKINDMLKIAVHIIRQPKQQLKVRSSIYKW